MLGVFLDEKDLNAFFGAEESKDQNAPRHPLKAFWNPLAFTLNHDFFEALKKTFTTAGGLYGFSMNPVQPHTTSSEARDCRSCHSSSKALGLGTAGLIDLRRHGLPMDFPPDKLGDEDGGRVQDCAHEGARPFSGDELKNIFRTGSCTSCHSEPMERTSSPDLPSSLKGADEMHQRLIELLVSPEKK